MKNNSKVKTVLKGALAASLGVGVVSANTAFADDIYPKNVDGNSIVMEDQATFKELTLQRFFILAAKDKSFRTKYFRDLASLENDYEVAPREMSAIEAIDLDKLGETLEAVDLIAGIGGDTPLWTDAYSESHSDTGHADGGPHTDAYTDSYTNDDGIKNDVFDKVVNPGQVVRPATVLDKMQKTVLLKSIFNK